MHVAEISAMIVRLRLRKEFKHASFTRKESDNLMVRCRLADGTVGWGEGIPRTYVTGESPGGAMTQIAATPLADQLGAECSNWQDVLNLCDAYQPTIDAPDPRGCLANANRCAVELSLLDAFGKYFGQSISQAIAVFKPAESIYRVQSKIQYSGAVSSGSFRKEMRSAIAMRLYGFRHCKVKVAMDSKIDGERLRRIRRWVGKRMDLRVDANEAWKPEEVVRRVVEMKPAEISSVEQPVAHAEVESLAEVRREPFLPDIMLDESLCGLPDGRRAIDLGLCDLFNIRISKCGGVLNSLRLAAMAWQAGLGYQLGCHPGESGILSAAGRHFATSVRDIRYREGSADRHLLLDQITRENMTFGYGGWATAIDRPGLGITVDETALEPLILDRKDYLLT